MARKAQDPLVAFDDAITKAISFLPWDYDRPDVPATMEDVLPRAVRAHNTLTELVLLVESWEVGENPAPGELLLLDAVKEIASGWRQR